MKTLRNCGTAATWSLLAATTALADSSDSFGSGANTFTLDFVDIGNFGNADDAGAGAGSFSSPYGGVLTEYRMGKFEISQEQIDKATAGGLANVIAGAHTGAEPAASITWYEAAAFVNWLNDQRTPGLKAYNLDGTATALTLWAAGDAWDNDPGAGVDLNLYRHKDAYYFLPSEDEWYKAAYHQNDGVTANYWDYATGSNTAPTQELTGGTTPGSAVYQWELVRICKDRNLLSTQQFAFSSRSVEECGRMVGGWLKQAAGASAFLIYRLSVTSAGEGLLAPLPQIGGSWSNTAINTQAGGEARNERNHRIPSTETFAPAGAAGYLSRQVIHSHLPPLSPRLFHQEAPSLHRHRMA